MDMAFSKSQRAANRGTRSDCTDMGPLHHRIRSRLSETVCTEIDQCLGLG